ncbi:MAG: TIGR00282 family metallophosphoesterase [Termitinemataceae bacterium]|nr:MAG: TIGR00282 family metallophosphoesterase [Termitinemataceae bacterium]
MRVLYVAEIVGKAGVFTFKKALPSLIKEYGIDFVIANADGATGAKGLGKQHAAYLRKLGANVITLGDFCFSKKDLTAEIDHIPYVLRPLNLSGETPGRGQFVYKCGNQKVAVVVLLGQSGFVRFHSENPIAPLQDILARLREQTPFVIVDYHACATAEKQTLFYTADGLCSAVIGSHTRVQTADERILEHGTAVITDAGRTGSALSVGGCEVQSCVSEFLCGIPQWKKESWDGLEIQGVVLDLDSNGNAASITRVKKQIADK